jgi:hypothetical protein
MVLTFASALYSTEKELTIPQDLMFPEMIGYSAHFPLKMIYYGTPFAWFTHESGVILPRTLRSYSFHFFLWPGFIAGILIYGTIYSAIIVSGYVIEQRMMPRRLRRLGLL